MRVVLDRLRKVLKLLPEELLEVEETTTRVSSLPESAEEL